MCISLTSNTKRMKILSPPLHENKLTFEVRPTISLFSLSWYSRLVREKFFGRSPVKNHHIVILIVVLVWFQPDLNYAIPERLIQSDVRWPCCAFFCVLHQFGFRLVLLLFVGLVIKLKGFSPSGQLCDWLSWFEFPSPCLPTQHPPPGPQICATEHKARQRNRNR